MPIRKPLTAIAATIVAVVGLTTPAAAAPGDLDTTFSGDGVLVANPSNHDDPIFGIAVQDDGKLVVAGVTGGNGGRFLVARYLPDGTPDPTFSGDGKVATDLGPGADVAFDVVIQDDGKIVAVGDRNHFSNAVGFAAIRYLPDGTLDTSFSGDGRTTADFPGLDEQAREAAIDSAGRIVVVGRSLGGQGHILTAVARYTPAGAPDPTFSGDGFRSIDVGWGEEVGHGVALLPDDRIVVAGAVHGPIDNAGWRSVILRLKPNGQFDPTWSGDGRVVRSVVNGYEDLVTVAVDVDGTVVAAGETDTRLAVQRYLANGAPDPSFSGDGVQLTDLPSVSEWVTAVALPGDGRVVVAGSMARGGGRTFVARYLADGTLDTGFSGDGFLPIDFSPRWDAATDLALQADGAAVISASVDDDDRLGVARVLAA